MENYRGNPEQMRKVREYSEQILVKQILRIYGRNADCGEVNIITPQNPNVQIAMHHDPEKSELVTIAVGSTGDRQVKSILRLHLDSGRLTSSDEIKTERAWFIRTGMPDMRKLTTWRKILDGDLVVKNDQDTGGGSGRLHLPGIGDIDPSGREAKKKKKFLKLSDELDS